MWNGVAVALVTLFEPDGSLAAEKTAAHAARLAAVGVRAVLVAGSTGEAAALSDAERVELVAAVRAACPGVPLLAGASGEWWRPAAERPAAVLKAGADAALVAPPHRGGDLAGYYLKVAEAAAGAPVFAYHFPGVAGGEVPIGALTGLPIAGVKDSTGDAARLAEQLDLVWPGAVCTGSAALLGYASWLGAPGAIVAAANVAPEDCLAAWDGDAAAQRRVARADRASRRRFPHGLKGAVAWRWGTPITTRLG